MSATMFCSSAPIGLNSAIKARCSLERCRILAGEKDCCRIARVLVIGMNFIETGRHGTLDSSRSESLTSPRRYHGHARKWPRGFVANLPSQEPKNHLEPLSLGIPGKARYRIAKRSPRRSRLRPSHSVKRPDCLRRLAPQSRFVPAHAVKQDWVKIGKAQKTLGDGARLQAPFERRTHGL